MNNVHPIFQKILSNMRVIYGNCEVCGSPMEFVGWRTVEHPAGEADLRQYECANCGHLTEELG